MNNVLNIFLRLKKWIIGVLAVAVFAILVLAVLYITTRKKAEERTSAFLSADTNTDIIFIGTSQVAADISPMELWEHYGYSSYILCATKDAVQRDLAMLKIALQYTTPKLIVIDTDRYWKQDSIEQQIAGYHMFADAIPLTRTKIESTLELYSENKDRLKILFPFSEYHARWKELEGADFSFDAESGMLRGATYGTALGKPTVFDQIDRSEKEVPEGIGQEILSRIISFCQERGIAIFLLTLPLEADEEQQRYFNSLDDLAERYGIEHVNLLSRPDIFNYDTDFADGAHMNVSGCRKITSYLGEQILPKYNVPSHFDDPTYMNEWGADYQKYISFKHDTMCSTEDITSFLVQCHDDTLSIALYIAGNSACFRDGQTSNLIRNIIDFQKYESAAEGQQNYYALIDYGTGLLREEIAPSGTIHNDTSFGDACFSFDDDGKPTLTVGDDEKNYFDSEGRGDIYIAVFDRWSGNHVCTKVFKTKRVLEAELRNAEEQK